MEITFPSPLPQHGTECVASQVLTVLSPFISPRVFHSIEQTVAAAVLRAAAHFWEPLYYIPSRFYLCDDLQSILQYTVTSSTSPSAS